MTKAKRMLSLLLAVIMILSVMPITASAAENDGTTGGIKTHKEYNEETGYLTLEAYVTGESQTQIVAQPVDIALVLDVSGSMEELKQYSWTDIGWYWAYKESDSFIKVTNRNDLNDLDTVYGAAEGTYLLHSDTLWTHGKGYTPMRYSGGEWQYLNKDKEWANVANSSYGSGDIYITKLNALKIAVKRFIDTANAASDPAHPNRISIIKFAGDKKDTIGDERYDSSNTDSGWSNYSQIVQALTAVNGNTGALKTTVNSLQASGATQADFGMQHAQTVLANTDSSRKKVVIMFTDGEPTSGNSFEPAVANGAITTAKALKDSGTTIFTVGCFSTTPKTDPTTYMNYVSSNYPNATSLTSGGASVSTKYYSTAATSADLTGIFKKISQEVGGASVTLTATTVLKDTISDYFNLDESVDGSRKIEVHTETCTAIDADGNPTAWQKDNDNTVYNVKAVGKTITVEGFNYSANWVGSHNGQPGGKKIVLRIPIKPIDEKCWGLGLPTNDAGNSGIYVDNKPVAPFSVPTVNFPYYEIVHVKQNADGTLSYTGDTEKTLGETVVPTETLANRVRIENASATVDLTTKVPNGYLYGGSFSDPACKTPWSYGTESAKSFRPQNGATYYIWEAPVDYLVPKSLSLSKTIDGQPNVIGFYLLTGVDRLYYQSAGFDVTDGSGNSISITDVGESGSTALNGGSGKVYQSLTTVYTNGTSATYKPGEGVFKPLSASSYLACFSVPDSAWKDAGRKVVFTPYWITLDGMKVTGIWTRTCESGRNDRVIEKTDEVKNASEITPYNAATQMMLTAYDYVAVDGSENAPSASVDPIDPIDPVDPVVPIDPIDPVTPVDPVEPAKQFSVTVYDGGSVYTLSAEAGEDISSRLVSAGMRGMRFAGWFLDERSTAAAELKNVQGDMDVYAKYVSDTYLTLRYRNVGLFRSRNVKLYAALDSADYAEAGFVIDGKAVSCPITKDAYTAFFLYGSTVREDNTLVSYTYGTSDLRYGDTVEITPYWVTLDGTTVYGTTQTLTYGRFGLM